MCGRVSQTRGILRLQIVEGMEECDSRTPKPRYRFNGAPSQELLAIRRDHATGKLSLDPLRWGLIPSWVKEPTGGRKPINAKAETVAKLPSFREAYKKRRCIVPVDLFFEWQAIKGEKTKQPYAIGMKDGSPFGLAGIWENGKDASGEWLRTFAIVTTSANELVGKIHDRMPVIVAEKDFLRWLGAEPEANELLHPFDPEQMTMWPISTRVNSPRNDDESIIAPLKDASSAVP